MIDGDTIRLWQKGPDVRLIGFNAPETRRAACVAERELGASARGRLHQLVQHGNLDFEFVACSCPPGAEGTAACNYGRRCGRLKAGNRDVGGILIEEGLAVPFNCGTNRCPRTPRPWCEFSSLDKRPIERLCVASALRIAGRARVEEVRLSRCFAGGKRPNCGEPIVNIAHYYSFTARCITLLMGLLTPARCYGGPTVPLSPH